MIDDSKVFCESVVDLINLEKGWSIEYAISATEGLEILHKRKYKVILLDLKMPGMSGLELLKKLEEINLIKKNYVIVLTGEITIENAVNSLQFGARDFVQKPSIVEFPELFLKRVSKGFDWQEERAYNEALKKERQKTIEESQLIVKSVGHDMSGSYYGSLMLRLQMLTKKINQIKNTIETDIINVIEEDPEKLLIDVKEIMRKVQSLAEDGVVRSYSIIELLKFFKALGEKLKHLGNAISIDKTHKKRIGLSGTLESALHVFTDSKIQENPAINIIEQYPDEKIEIFASQEDLIRVFLNIIENAYKAMEGKGTLRIEAFVENDYAIVKISDSGCGIPKEKLDKIWRPDYTSWKNETGTGLGLLICRKAIENSDGEIHVSSIVGKGTTFTIKFKLYNKGDIHEKENSGS